MVRLMLHIQKSPPGAACGQIAACSGLSVATTARGKFMDDSGIPAAPIQNQTITTQADNIVKRALHVESSAGLPGLVEWSGGNWVIWILVSVANVNMKWTRFYICRVNTSCGSVTTIGSRTGLGYTCNIGTKAFNVNTAAGGPHVGDPTDVIYVVYGFRSTSGAAETCTLSMNQLVSTPLGIAKPMAVAYGGAGTMTTTVTRARLMTLALAGVGAFTSAITRSRTMSVAFAGVATLTSTITRFLSMAVAFTGVGTLTATMTRHLSMAVAFVGTGVLAALLRVTNPMGDRFRAVGRAVLPARAIAVLSVVSGAIGRAVRAPQTPAAAANAQGAAMPSGEVIEQAAVMSASLGRSVSFEEAEAAVAAAGVRSRAVAQEQAQESVGMDRNTQAVDPGVEKAEDV
jgi:hypothetical protein